MSPKAIIPLVFVIAFGGGAYLWYLTNDNDLLLHFTTAANSPEEKTVKREPDLTADTTLVSIDGQAITSADVEWEYQIHVSGIAQDPELEPFGDFDPQVEGQLSPIRKRIIAGLVERKVLYKFLERDSTFNLEDPGRFTTCLTKWQEAVAAVGEESLPPALDKERLKNRLCEQSVLLQYLEERIFSHLAVSNDEIETYYKERIDQFKVPEKVTIRQILLADDSDARVVRNKLKRDNFMHLAKEKSIAPEAENGGLLGPFARGELPRVFDVAFDMRVYEISKVQKSTYGFHIIMPIQKYEARELPLSEVREQVKSKILEMKKEKAYEELLDQALATISVKTPKSLW